MRIIKKWTPKEFIERMQKKVAKSAIGPSAMRGQLQKGVLTKIQDYCADIPLNMYSINNEKSFFKRLAFDTKAIMRYGAEWGTARKALNLFVRDVFYNKYTSSKFRLDKLEKYLEIPLDNKVIKRLRIDRGNPIDKWKSIKSLKPEQSDNFQRAALDIATNKGIRRVHLDTEYWTED